MATLDNIYVHTQIHKIQMHGAPIR